MTTHELKTWPEPFTAITEGRKTFEARYDDRGYTVGDVLRLREWDPATEKYSGSFTTVRVTHLLRGPGFGVEAGHVIMSIR